MTQQETNYFNWPNDVRLKMIERSEFYGEPKIYQYGFFDGYQEALKLLKGINPESVEKMREYCEAEKCFAENGYIIFGSLRTQVGGESAKGILKRMRDEALNASNL